MIWSDRSITGPSQFPNLPDTQVPWNREDIDPAEERFYSGGTALDLRCGTAFP